VQETGEIGGPIPTDKPPGGVTTVHPGKLLGGVVDVVVLEVVVLEVVVGPEVVVEVDVGAAVDIGAEVGVEAVVVVPPTSVGGV
jgi:hypothetical protein